MATDLHGGFELRIRLGEGAPLGVPLRQRGFTVGASPFADLTLEAPEMARRHFSIQECEEGHDLSDLSGHGLLLNDTPITRAALKPKDTWNIGPWRFTYDTRQEEHAPAPPDTLATLTPSLRVQCAPGELTFKGAHGEERRRIDRPLILGSGSDAHITLPDPYASRRHAQLIPSPDGLILRDLQSLNGTWIGALRVVEVILPAEAEFRIGQTTLRLKGPSPKEKSGPPEPDFYGMVGRHPSMQRVYGLIGRIAVLGQTVLITGETGTGKELAARAVHESSERRGLPFVSVNCGAIASELIESELFGHERGSFSGATTRRAGAFESARNGTVFLDEIGELPLALQAKLLRALENQEIKPIGSDSVRKHQARVVAATNRDLVNRVKEGGFREDLFWRLNVLPIKLPPLRERREDIPLLAERFLTESGADVKLTAEAMEMLIHHYWPGNIRELRNVLLTSLIYNPEALHAHWLDEDQLVFSGLGAPALVSAPPQEPSSATTLQQNEARLILEALAQYGGNKRSVARALGISKTTLYEKIRKYNLTSP